MAPPVDGNPLLASKYTSSLAVGMGTSPPWPPEVAAQCLGSSALPLPLTQYRDDVPRREELTPRRSAGCTSEQAAATSRRAATAIRRALAWIALARLAWVAEDACDNLITCMESPSLAGARLPPVVMSTAATTSVGTKSTVARANASKLAVSGEDPDVTNAIGPG